MSSRTDVEFYAAVNKKLFDALSAPLPYVKYTGGSQRKEICSPDVRDIYKIPDTSPVSSWIVAPKDGHFFSLTPEVTRTTADIEITEDAIIQSAVHDDPFAY